MLSLFDFKLKKYKRIREVAVPLMTEVGKSIPKELFHQAATDLKILDAGGKTLVMEDAGEIDFILDRAIHDIPFPQKRWIEQICEQKIQNYTPDQQAVLRAHLHPSFSLYEVASAEPGRGVWLLDVFTSHELFVMDVGFGTTAQKGHLLATRIVTLDELNLTAGVGMPFSHQDKNRLVDHFTRLFEENRDAMSREGIMREHTPYLFLEYRKGDMGIEFVHAVRPVDRQDEDTPSEDEEERKPAQEEAKEKSIKAGRNAPCPCGSGKKYKKCCLPKGEARFSVAAAWSYTEKKHLIKSSGELSEGRCYVNSEWKEKDLLISYAT